MSWWQWGLVAGGATLGLYAAFVLWLLRSGRHEQARAVAGFVPDCVVLFRRLLADERVSRGRKFVLIGVVAYLAMPLDLVPDVIPVVGQLDDAIVVVIALRWILRSGGPELLREHWPGPSASLAALTRLVYGASSSSR